MALIAITDSDLGDGSIERSVLLDHEVRTLNARTADEIVAGATGADALLVQWASIDPGVLDRLPNLRVIVRYGIGLDNIDVEAARERGIRVANVPDYCIYEVAAHAIAFIVMVARRIPQLVAGTAAGEWSLDGVEAPKAPHDDPVGVAGLGRMGRLVAQQARALGHPVLGWDPYADPWPDDVVRVRSLADLATGSRHLTLHLPLTAETAGIVSTAVLRALGPSGHLVNTARGGLVDEPTLLAALSSGELGFASLDVLSTEPPTGVSAQLANHPRTAVTPHAAYYSDASRRRLQRRAAELASELLTESVEAR